MMATLEIRRAQAGDAAVLSSLLSESFAEFRPLYTSGGFAATALGAEAILVRMLEGPVWIAVRLKVAVGTVAAIKMDDSVYMRGMAVLPGARGLGVGAALLREVESWTIGEGCKRIFLSTTPFLSSAIRMYERFGFQRTKEPPQNLFGTPLFTMEKILGS